MSSARVRLSIWLTAELLSKFQRARCRFVLTRPSALIRGFDVHHGALRILDRRPIDNAERGARFVLCPRNSVCSEDRAQEPERDDLQPAQMVAGLQQNAPTCGEYTHAPERVIPPQSVGTKQGSVGL
jgi:hypothetical protein